MPESERAEGLALLKVAVQACRIQLRQRGWFILEHPQGASSWETDIMKSLLSEPGVHTVVLDQCEFGLVSRDAQGFAPARKATKLATNLVMAEFVLGKRCSHGHRHVQLVNDRAGPAQVYPRGLCLAFVEAYRLELEHKRTAVHQLELNGMEEKYKDDLHFDLKNDAELFG